MKLVEKEHVLGDQRTSAVRYSLGMFGTSIPINMFKTFAAVFYVDKLGLSAKMFATVPIICTFTDCIFILVFGYLSDKGKDNNKKRKTWIMVAAPLLATSLYLFFSPAQSAGTSMIYSHVLLLYLTTSCFDAVININYGALFPELFVSERSRMRTNAYRQAFQMCAMTLSIALTPLIVLKVGYQITAASYGLLATIVIWYSATGYKEHLQSAETSMENNSKSSKKPRLRLEQVVEIIKNKHLWFYGLAVICYSVMFSLVTQGIPFFVKYTLRLPISNVSLILCSVFGVTILGIYSSEKVSNHVRYTHVWVTSYAVIGIGLFLILLKREFAFSVIGASLVGFGMGGIMTTSDIIGAMLIDEDQVRTGKLRAGLYTSFFALMFRTSGIIIGIAYYLVEILFGFVSGEFPGNHPSEAAVFLTAVVPLTMVIFGVLFANYLSHLLLKEEGESDGKRDNANNAHLKK